MSYKYSFKTLCVACSSHAVIRLHVSCYIYWEGWKVLISFVYVDKIHAQIIVRKRHVNRSIFTLGVR